MEPPEAAAGAPIGIGAGAAAGGAYAGGAGAAAGGEEAGPPARLARYSANDSALWIACCLPFGSFGSYAVGVGSRVASPPPKPFPPIMMTLDIFAEEIGATGDMNPEAAASRQARRRKRNISVWN